MRNKAFTLIEVLIAITLTTVVITAVCGLILSTMLANQRNIHTVQATYLAEETLEAVRFMRDSNWLQNYSWDSGALWGVSTLYPDDIDFSKTFYLFTGMCALQNRCFSLSADEEDGQVEMPNGLVFNRSVTFEPVEGDENNSDAMQVTARVYWNERGKEREVLVSTYLTAWQ